MTTLAQETWTGTTGAAWPAQWTGTAGASGSTATIQSNAGRLTFATVSGYATGRVEYLSGMSASADFDLTVTVTFATIQEEYLLLAVRSSSDVFTSGYGVQLYPANGTATCGLVKLTTSGPVTLGAGDLTAGSWTASVARKVRLRVVGTTLQVKVWDASGSEPGTWLSTITDSTYSASGRVGMYCMTGNTTSGSFVTLDDLTVTDGASAPFVTANVDVSGSGTLSATVTPLATRSAALSGAGTLTDTVTPLAVRSAALSGSGALTATVVHVATAALSGSGTLTADFGASTVNVNLTGSGTLTATRPSIAVNPTLTGSGTLTATVVVPAYMVSLTGSGQLSAVVVPALTVAGSIAAEGWLANSSTEIHLFSWIFRPPTQEVYVRLAGRGLVASYSQGLSVYRVGGQWVQRLAPTADDLAAADRYYPGGYEHLIPDAERSELIAAGFGSHLSYEEVTA